MFAKIVKVISKIIGAQQSSLVDLYRYDVLQEAKSILCATSQLLLLRLHLHLLLLHSEFQLGLLLSGSQFRFPLCKKQHTDTLRSHSAISLLNLVQGGEIVVLIML